MFFLVMVYTLGILGDLLLCHPLQGLLTISVHMNLELVHKVFRLYITSIII